MANKTYLDNIDIEKVENLLGTTSINVKYFNDITSRVSKEYSNDLDNIMQDIYIKQKKIKDIPILELESYYLELSNLLYFMGDKLEQLGVCNDMSKAARQEIYNKAYLANQLKDVEKRNKTTVAENNAIAEQYSQYESVVNSIYDRAYKMLKYKIDSAFEMVNTFKKLITRRMQEADMSNYQKNIKSNFNN